VCAACRAWLAGGGNTYGRCGHRFDRLGEGAPVPRDRLFDSPVPARVYLFVRFIRRASYPTRAHTCRDARVAANRLPALTRASS
jgi:hypothetical protein